MRCSRSGGFAHFPSYVHLCTIRRAPSRPDPSGPCINCLIFQNLQTEQALQKMIPASQIFTQVLLKERSVRLLKRVAIELEEPTARPTPDYVVELCSNHTLNDCMPPFLHSLLDEWPGGYIFLYWAVDEGPKWLRDMIKEGSRVCSSRQKYYTGFLLSS